MSRGEESLEALHGALDAPGADGSSWLCGGLSLYGKNSRTVLGETFSQMDGGEQFSSVSVEYSVAAIYANVLHRLEISGYLVPERVCDRADRREFPRGSTDQQRKEEAETSSRVTTDGTDWVRWVVLLCSEGFAG